MEMPTIITYEECSRSFASLFVRSKNFKMYATVKRLFLPKSYEFQADVTSL